MSLAARRSGTSSNDVLHAPRVLVVEDEPLLRRVLAASLRSTGSQVEEAASLDDAARCLARSRFDVLVVDVGLPDGDGLSLLPRVTPERALVITANPSAARFAEAGVRHHLRKPMDLRRVREVVAEIAANATQELQ